MRMQRDVDVKFVNLPPVCESQPKSCFLYCEQHLPVAIQLKLPTTKKEVLDSENATNSLSKSTATSVVLDEMIEENSIPNMDPPNTQPQANSCANSANSSPWCKKDLGHRKKTGNWSRGLFVFVHGCGHISSFSSLYQ
ncbi:hypothetical protein BV898_19385 [Hypsibius exemplaris]|uniref:Uncharacterized protein n=1 Tax=Hypsibius exemplaris TaxID=2072580 RepID=A0A9X6NJ54_HYPEX|nr:hypothetical protein BV898_19385 [Hypsibius exemplaris]